MKAFEKRDVIHTVDVHEVEVEKIVEMRDKECIKEVHTVSKEVPITDRAYKEIYLTE